MFRTFGRNRLAGALLAASTLLLVACAPAGPAPTTAKPTEAAKPTTAAASPSPAAAAPSPSPSPNPATTTSDVITPPSGAGIKITSPTASGPVPAGDLKVTYDLTNITTVAAASATKVEDLHVHVLLDVDPAPYIGTSIFIPPGNPSIIHTAAKEVTFNNVQAGPHQVTVILTGANHISTKPPVTDTLKFTVQ